MGNPDAAAGAENDGMDIDETPVPTPQQQCG